MTIESTGVPGNTKTDTDYTVKSLLTTLSHSKKVIGVLSPDPSGNHTNIALGEGSIWVALTNGDIETGDYLTTSPIPGIAQRQDSGQLQNYTVAKSLIDCSFGDITQQFTITTDPPKTITSVKWK